MMQKEFHIDNILLISSLFNTIEIIPDGIKPEIEFKIKEILNGEIEHNSNGYKQRFMVVFSFRAFHEKSVFFSAETGYGVTYQAESQDCFDLIKNRGIIVSHVLPYFRAFLSQSTSASMFPTFFLPPTNTNSLFEQYEQENAERQRRERLPEGS